MIAQSVRRGPRSSPRSVKWLALRSDSDCVMKGQPGARARGSAAYPPDSCRAGPISATEALGQIRTFRGRGFQAGNAPVYRINLPRCEAIGAYITVTDTA